MSTTTNVEHRFRSLHQSPRLTRRSLGAFAAAVALSARFGRAVAAQEATPTTQSAMVHVNGIDLFYEEAGSGPPLLNIPPLSSTGFSLPALEPHFRVITFDNRGAGRSLRSPGSLHHAPDGR